MITFQLHSATRYNDVQYWRSRSGKHSTDCLPKSNRQSAVIRRRSWVILRSRDAAVVEIGSDLEVKNPVYTVVARAVDFGLTVLRIR